uniref:Omega-x desaturase 1 n=1 Tax=Hediste diversicolor TaxID=126592 RepID=A0A411KYE1_HEDDI|nr:Omega-x desaturase 1 [Hediste diversicolor]
MVVTEPIKFAVGTVFFTRSFVRALYEYLKDDKIPSKEGPKGIGINQQDSLPKELPSVVDIKKKLPKHCFEPDVPTSMYYAVKDLVLVAVTFACVLYAHQYSSPWIWWPSLLMYWAVQGTFFTSIFVIGHDCGHDSFSNHKGLNDLVGNVMHSFLMCPFYMWKLSHRVHHQNNANFDKDEVFYPIKESESIPGVTVPGFGFGTGWLAYLFVGYGPLKRKVNHFDLQHPFFRNHLIPCLWSVLGLTIWGTVLYSYGRIYGFWPWFNYYFVPLFIFSSYMVIITFLHHTEVNTPWYSDSQWDFVKGQLSTIDRDYGPVHYIIHSIGTHQMHHMFTHIPHYHLEEATTHFRKNFPDLVRTCNEPILPSFMRMFKKFEAQSVIPDDTVVHYYK